MVLEDKIVIQGMKKTGISVLFHCNKKLCNSLIIYCFSVNDLVFIKIQMMNGYSDEQ